MIYYIDIDETICTYEGERHYPNAKPIHKNIQKINELYNQENIVVYWTARGTTTGIDWAELTRNQLEQWGAKYTDIKFGKPNYDLFICDKAINSETFFKEQDV